MVRSIAARVIMSQRDYRRDTASVYFSHVGRRSRERTSDFKNSRFNRLYLPRLSSSKYQTGR